MVTTAARKYANPLARPAFFVPVVASFGAVVLSFLSLEQGAPLPAWMFAIYALLLVGVSLTVVQLTRAPKLLDRTNLGAFVVAIGAAAIRAGILLVPHVVDPEPLGAKTVDSFYFAAKTGRYELNASDGQTYWITSAYYHGGLPESWKTASLAGATAYLTVDRGTREVLAISIAGREYISRPYHQPDYFARRNDLIAGAAILVGVGCAAYATVDLRRRVRTGAV